MIMIIDIKEEKMKEKKLTLLKKGEKGKVIKVDSQGSVRKRMMDMGIVKGVEVLVQGVAPFGDPVEVQLRGYTLTLRKNEADCILVEVS